MAIQRIVKMTFQPERCADFEKYFDGIKEQVGGQPGCFGVKLLKDVTETGIYFTYSTWESEECLNAYRATPLFASVWPVVKNWFAEKAEAWSTEVIANSELKVQ